MRLRQHVLLALALAGIGWSPSIAAPRDLTFEERVAAQAAIERVYYSHQSGAVEPFEKAVPRAVLEKKVRTYLKQSLVLESIWSRPVIAEALHAEMDRIASRTRLPDRLAEIVSALKDDSFLIEECFARSSLVDRLSRNQFAYD